MKIILRWDDIEDMIVNVYEKIGKKYDLIISIDQGGMVVSKLLAELLDIKTILHYSAISYDKNNKKMDRMIYHPMFSFNDIKDKTILLVDDLVDSGDTAKTIMNDCLQHCSVIKLATLIRKTKSVIVPDYFCTTYNHDWWIEFPWETIVNKRRQK